MNSTLPVIEHLNFDWEFCPKFDKTMISGDKNEYIFERVNIPHTSVEIPYNNFDENIYQIDCCYRKKFYISKDMINRYAWLHFDGVMAYAKIFVNGEFVGEHKGGYTPFKLDITKALKYGQENLLVIYVDSHEREEIPPFGFVVDYLTYGGIYREVRIAYVNEIAIANCHIKTKNVLEDKKLLDLELYIENYKTKTDTLEIAFTILYKNSICHEFTKTVELKGEYSEKYNIVKSVENVDLWDINNPNLYHLNIRVSHEEKILDEKTIRFGFREIAYENDGLYLNGEKIKLRGLNRHQSFPYVGYAMPKSAQYKDAEILKYSLGVNTVRLSHYPQSNHFMDRCDEVGLLVFDEIPGWQNIGDSEEWRNLAKENVREMIMKDWNHPSVFIWGVRINESKDCEELYLETNAIAHALDETRPTGGVRYLEGSQLLEDVYTFNDFSHTGMNKGLKDRKKVTKKEVPYLVTEHNGHMFPTKKYDSEPHRIDQAKRHLNVLEAMYKNNDISGAIGWCMFDYNTHEDFGSGDKICYHGVMDMFRIEKYAAYVYSSMQDQEPVMYVANSMDIGDFPAGIVGDTYIFTNCDYVNVYKNDLFIGKFYPAKELYPSVPHPPVIVDNYIGNQIHDNEPFNDRDANFIKNSFIKISKLGEAGITLVDKAKMGLILVKYKLSFSDVYQLYGKYMSNWGDSATTYKFEGYINEKCVLTVNKSQLGDVHMKVSPDTNILVEAETYDVTRIVVNIEDNNSKPLFYSNESVFLSVEGPIEIIGPKHIPLIGGSSAFWVKSTGLAGHAKVIIASERYGEEKILIDVLKV